MARSRANSGRSKRKRNFRMDAAAIRGHADAVLEAVANGDRGPIADAFEYLLAMARDRDDPREARSHVLYFTTNYVFAVQHRDCDDAEAREVNALTDLEIHELCSHVAGHPGLASARAAQGSLDRVDMVLAFTLQLVGQVFDADGELCDAEREFWAQLVRQPVLQARGLVEGGELTPKFAAARSAAMVSLGPLLLPEDKRMIVDTLVQSAACDGDIDPREVETIMSGLKMLGMSPQEVVGLLRARTMDRA